MNNKEFTKRAIRHGETLLIPIDAVPSEAKEIYNGNKYIVSHSESGHHHIAVGNVTVFEGLNATMFLRVNQPSKLEHLKSFDKHETKDLFEGDFEIRIKKQYNPFEKVLERVRD